MTLNQLLWNGLRYHWRANLAIVLGCLVGSAVLTGALLVGDSMRGSLRGMTLERLGAVDQVLVSGRFFSAEVATRLQSLEGFSKNYQSVTPAILIQGAVIPPPLAEANEIAARLANKKLAAVEKTKRLRDLPEYRAAAVLLTDDTGKVIAVSPQATALLGHDPTAITRATSAGAKGLRGINQASFHTLLQILETETGTLAYVRPDGQKRTLLVQSALTDDKFRVTVVQDMTRGQHTHVPGVKIIGTTPEFWRLLGSTTDAETLARQVLINEELAREMGLERVEETRFSMEIRLAKASHLPRESLMADRADPVDRLNVEVTGILPNTRAGRFGLDATQKLPRNVYVPLEKLSTVLARELRPRGARTAVTNEKTLANALLLSVRDQSRLAQTSSANDFLRRALDNNDAGLLFRTHDKSNIVVIESASKILDDTVVAGVREAAQATGLQTQEVLTHLANNIQQEGGDRKIPYSIVTALGPTPTGFSSLTTTPADIQPSKGQILLNWWAAERLQAPLGSRIILEYYTVGDDGLLKEQAHTFTFVGVARNDEVAVDARWTPEYPGITDANNVADWRAPFPMDMKRVRERVDGVAIHEKYWKDFRVAPKAYISLEDGQALWGTRYGKCTSVRVASPNRDARTVESAMSGALRETLTPRRLGLEFRANKAEDLQASSGSTPFDILFLCFSFFLIVAGALLVALLFRLSVERRASEVGLLLALGWRRAAVQRLLLGEGFLLAAIGSALGLFAAVGYARAIITGLTTWWNQAVSTPYISFHAAPLSFIIGWMVATGVAMVAIYWSCARLGRGPIPPLLSPGFTFSDARAVSSKWHDSLAIVLGLFGGALLIFFSPREQIGAFFGGGALLLVGSLAWLRQWLRPRGGIHYGGGRWALALFGARNAGRYPARSVLTASLLAFAAYVIVAVSLFRHGAHTAQPRFHSGDGGFALLGRTDLPLLQDLSDPQNATDLNLSDESVDLLQHAEVHALRLRAGDDASCLNIYKPRNPNLLGVSEKFIQRGGFLFASSAAKTTEEKQNPWLTLHQKFDDGAIPAIGDAETLQYILQVGLGSTLEIADARGPVKLRIVGCLAGSIFQGELLVAESQLVRAFSDVAGARFLLFAQRPDAPEDWGPRLTTTLEKDLGDYGIAINTTGRVLEAYHAVANTYISTFQSLGALGLLLGTLGMAAVLLRNVLERQSELALLRAVGFRLNAIGWIVHAENLFLLSIGLVLGTGCALVAVLPPLWARHEVGTLTTLLYMLMVVMFAGVVSGWLALRSTLRQPILSALRAE